MLKWSCGSGKCDKSLPQRSQKAPPHLHFTALQSDLRCTRIVQRWQRHSPCLRASSIVMSGSGPLEGFAASSSACLCSSQLIPPCQSKLQTMQRSWSQLGQTKCASPFSGSMKARPVQSGWVHRMKCCVSFSATR